MSLPTNYNSIQFDGEAAKPGSTSVTVLMRDPSGNVQMAIGTSVPGDEAGYAKSCLFVKTNAADGTAGLYENIGTTTSADFNLVGAISAGEITLAEGNLLIGNASSVATALDIGNTDGGIAIGNGTTATVAALSGDVTMTNGGVVSLGADVVDGSNIADASISLEHLDSAITPSHIVVFAGEFTTAGGDTDETISVPGVVATDLVHVTMQTAGASPVTIIDAACGTDQIDVDMSADPSTDHILTYTVYRAAA